MINLFRFHKETRCWKVLCWKNFKEIFTDIRLSIKYTYQRIKYGYCDYDMFSFDYTLCEYIIGGLTYLIKNRHGTPMAYIEKVMPSDWNMWENTPEGKQEEADQLLNDDYNKIKRNKF